MIQAPRHPGTARALGVALVALIAFAAWRSAELFDPTGGTDDLLAAGAAVAAMCCGRAAVSVFLLDRGRTRTWAAWVWSGVALLSLLFLVATSFASHLTG